MRAQESWGGVGLARKETQGRVPWGSDCACSGGRRVHVLRRGLVRPRGPSGVCTAWSMTLGRLGTHAQLQVLTRTRPCTGAAHVQTGLCAQPCHTPVVPRLTETHGAAIYTRVRPPCVQTAVGTHAGPACPSPWQPSSVLVRRRAGVWETSVGTRSHVTGSPEWSGQSETLGRGSRLGKPPGSPCLAVILAGMSRTPRLSRLPVGAQHPLALADRLTGSPQFVALIPLSGKGNRGLKLPLL